MLSDNVTRCTGQGCSATCRRKQQYHENAGKTVRYTGHPLTMEECPGYIAPISGECYLCGCTAMDACYHPDYGTCWWENYEETLCSHCRMQIDPEFRKMVENDL